MKKALDHFEGYLYSHPNVEKIIYHASVAAKKAKQYERAIDYSEQLYLRNPRFMKNNLKPGQALFKYKYQKQSSGNYAKNYGVFPLISQK